ncbi:hypothetical protein Tco_0812063, partial [Tanacetum coccineum]
MVPPNNLGHDLSGKAVNETQYRANPKEFHLIAVKRIFRYLKGIPSLGLWYPKCSDFDLKGYSDSDYAGCNMDRKSTSGACQLLGGKLVCQSAKKQQSVAMSSAEAEYVAASGCCANILWMKSQLTDHDIIYSSIISFRKRDYILKEDIKIHFIPTQYQLADIFTKPLDEPTFKRLIVELGDLGQIPLGENSNGTPNNLGHDLSGKAVTRLSIEVPKRKSTLGACQLLGASYGARSAKNTICSYVLILKLNMGMWDHRVSIGQTLDENSGMSILEPLIGLIIERGTRNCNRSTSNEMVSISIFIMAEQEIDNLTREQYLAFTQGNQEPGVVKQEIGGNVNFEIKSQFMQELREDTFSRNKNDDAHEHVERPLRDGWTDFLQEPSIPRISLKKPLSKGTVHHQKLASSLKKSATSSRKETRHYTKLENGAMNHQLLDSQGPISGMTPVQALTAIQTMVDHSQKWHDGSSSRNIESSSNSEGIDAIVNKLENLGRDMKKLKEKVHAIQVGCQICGGAHLDKDCTLNDEIKSVEEVKYGEFGQPFPNRNDGRFNRGGYDQPSSDKRRPNLTEIINKYMEEASKRHTEQDKWLKKFYQSIEASRESHDKIIQGLETKVKSLVNEVKGRTNSRKFKECKTIYTEDRLPLYTPFYYSP